jgi:excisionase family DNA binding protein
VPVAGAAPAAAPGIDMLSPADVGKALGVPESDVMAIITSGELKAKKIGASYRITRAALDAYLAL